MNFIKKLLLSSKFDTILVIVDQLTKQIIFISAHDTIISVNLACLFVLHMFSKYSVPSHITSNRGLEFVLNSSIPQTLLLTCGFTLLQATTPKVIDKPNAQIKLLSNTSVYIVTTSKITSLNSYLSQSLPIIMLQVLLLVFFHSLPIRDIIQTLLFTLNTILLPPEPITSLQISMSYKVSLKLKSLWPNNVIRNPLICNIPPLLISKQVINFLSRLSSSEPLSLQRNFLKNILDLMKSLSSLVYYCSPSVFQSLYALFIQFSICPCLNPPYPTLSPREHN